MKYRKKLIEVALPLKAINEASAREKSIRHGHPSTLHLWWARRPLAACRAVLFASLVDDPDSDPQFAGDEDAAASKRAQLFSLIEELVQWENSNNPEVIRSARAEIARCVASRKVELGELADGDELAPGLTVREFIRNCWCLPRPMGTEKAKKGSKKSDRVRFAFGTTHLPPEEVVNAFLAEHAPPVLDPFAGGGSIPLEAQRLGLRAYASDLNPVAVLINKALIEIPPKFAGRPPVNPASRKDPKSKAREWRGAEGLAEDVRYYGKWMRDEAEKRIGHLYPKVKVTEEMAADRPDLEPYVGEELTVIAWLWARTVASPDPAVRGAHVPLAKSFVLSAKPGEKAWISYKPTGDTTYAFTVECGSGSAPSPTVSRSGATCIISNSSIPLAYVREEGKAGRLGERLMAIVAKAGSKRIFLPPNDGHEATAKTADYCDYPDTSLPKQALGFRVQNYGMTEHRDLFTARQLIAMNTMCSVLRDLHEHLKSQEDVTPSYADAVVTYLGLGVGRMSDICNSLCGWESSKTQVRHLFTRHAIPMLWDYGENNVFGGAAGDFEISVGNLCRAIDQVPANGFGTARQSNAIDSAQDIQPFAFSTDPPYYDNVPYADLSDFFYVWLRRCLQTIYPELLRTLLVPKAEELVAEPFRHDGAENAKLFFEDGMKEVLQATNEASTESLPATIFYAFKQSEESDNDEIASTGWETFLNGLIDSGWQINGTWPVRTELSNRIRGIGSNALASSVVLVCRQRDGSEPLGTRREFLQALKQELPDALRHLQQGNIAPVDLAQAAIGPGMGVFSRYARVMEADGSAMTMRAALALINQTLDEVLAEQEGEFDADTRWALAWFEEHGVDEGPYGTAETLSKAKNTAVSALVEAGMVTSGSGKVRLMKRDELPDDWDPATDKRLRHWETVQHLIRALEADGESGAAELLRKLGTVAEPARDLAYRLYSLCERKKWAQEALAYNGLVTAWPEIEKLARAARNEAKQQTFA